MKRKIVALLLAIMLAIPFIKGENAEFESSPEPSLPPEEENITTNDTIDRYVRYPNALGDIIFEIWGIIPYEFKKVNHAALYIGNGKLVEADPHMENWNESEKATYEVMAYTYFAGKKANESFELWLCLKEFVYSLHNRSYSGNTNYGKVEEDGFEDVKNSKFYCYGEVWINDTQPAFLWMRNISVKFVKDRASSQWPLVRDGLITYGSRPFDYVSPWIEDKKQCDEYTLEMVMANLSLAKTLDYGYGCSELVWAAWYHATKYDPLGRVIDLDSDDTTFKYVWPWEIKSSPHVKIYYNSTDNNTSLNMDLALCQPLNLKLIYSNQTIYAYNVTSIEEINGEYYLKPSNNEMYPMANLTDLEILEQNL